MNLLAELKRRNVIRMAGLYVVGAWLIVQVAETVLPAFDVPGWVLRALILLLAIGFVPALVVSWLFELTPEGLKRDADVTPAQSIASQTGRRMDRLIFAGLVALIAVIAADRYWPRATHVAAETAIAATDAASPGATDAGPFAEPVSVAIEPGSIAVLPFADMSADGDQAWFGDGISEEVLNVLVGVPGLTVASRTSSFQFRAQEALGIPAIAEMLKVRHVLEGSVRRAGNRIRITAQLIDASRDAHLWSETFDRTLTAENLFDIQDEIARAIVAAIDGNLGVQVGAVAPVPQRTGNVDAYALYLQARPRYYAREDLQSVDELLGRAVEIDQMFVDALAMRASVAMLSSDYDVPLWGGRQAARDRARQLATQALAVAPGHGLALGVLAQLQTRRITEGDAGAATIEEVSQGYDAAVAVDPNHADLLNWRGRWRAYIGRFADAEADLRHCREVEPAYAPCRLNLVTVLTVQGRRDEAARELLDSAAGGAMLNVSSNLVLLRELDMRDAFVIYGAALPRLRGWYDFAALYDALGEPAVDHRMLRERLVTLFGSDSKAVTLASHEVRVLLTALGDHSMSPENLFVWLPILATHRQSPAFKASVIGNGRLRYWQAQGFPPQCRAVGTDDFTCD
jgi:adenylate cyclase